jgi:TolB protein
VRPRFPLLATALALATLAPAQTPALEDNPPIEGPTIRIVGEARPRIPIAVPPFNVPAEEPQMRDVAAAVQEIVRNDLDYSGYFQIVPPEYYDLISPWSDRQANYKEWLGIGADALLVGEARLDGPGSLVVEGRVFDTAEKRMVLGKRYRGQSDLQRLIAHRLSNEIIQQYTGRTGVAMTRIAYVSQIGEAKEIHVMDYDGARVKRITGNGSINISPSWSPNGEQIAFLSYRSGVPEILLLESNGELRRPPFRQGGELNSAPAWSPDGRTLAFSSSRDGNAEIYLMRVSDGRLTRLTRNQAIDTSPAWSPNGRELAFTSDRSGIYIMDREGANVRRATFDVSYCDSPSWSPLGEMLAFTARVPGGFDIFVQEIATGRLTQLTADSGINETPRWSPDGQHIVFASNRTGSFDIYTMDRFGAHTRRLTRGGNSYAPSWSR